ncbi:hypothetical protein BDD12DRAFT_141063 [Trichophaea hybrida]|nr:hypothetical protein BDD12DRAFT_141063 [Trichophaea hybrida]
MPVPQTTRFSASPLQRATVTTSPSTTPCTTRSGQSIQQQRQPQLQSQPQPQSQSQLQTQTQTQTQQLNRIVSNEDFLSTCTNQSPASPERGECAVEGRSPTSNDAATGATYSGGHITPTHEMAQSQLQMSEHEAAMMAGNRSMGAPTPTSTSSYGGAKDDVGYGTASGRVGSEFGGTDDGYGGGIMGGGGMGDTGMHGRVSPQHYGHDVGDYEGGLGDTGERNGIEESNRGLFKMKSEGDGSEHSGPWTETKTKAGKERKRLPLACIMCRRKK